MEQHQEPDHAQTYQHKMQAFYAEDAAAKFKQKFWPADPFETGVLVSAENLDISEMVAVCKGAKALQNGEYGELFSLIRCFRSLKGSWSAQVYVNPLWVQSRQQRSLAILELLHSYFCGGNDSSFEERLEEIVGAGDPQLIEYLRQIEEALNVSWLSLMPVSVTVVGDSPTILIEQEAE